MKKIKHVLTIGAAVMAMSACSRIDANTSNSVPTDDAYAATVTANYAGAGVTGTSSADAYVNQGTSTTAPASMRYGTRTITEASFLMEAASSSMLEVQLGKLALERSANPEVKEFARMMVDHHTKVNQELMTLASGMNVTLPATLMPEHQKLADQLSKMTGSAFDAKYIDEIEDVHEKDMALFDVVSTGAQTTTIKAFAIRTLPVLRVHEHQAEQLEGKVNK